MEHYSREFYTDAPRRFTRQHRERVLGVRAVIFGMQDILLEVPDERVQEVIELHEDRLLNQQTEEDML